MRESIGAAWIFSLVLVFILMFTGFVAVSINYARAFQLKNVVVNLIEENEGVYGRSTTLENSIKEYIELNGYTAHDALPDNIEEEDSDGRNMKWERVACVQNGNQINNECTVAIYRASQGDYDYLNDTKYKNAFKGTTIPVKRDYYKVITFFDFDLPVFRNLLTFRVNGETQVIYDFGKCIEGGSCT